MNLQSKLVRALASSALLSSFATFTVACSAPADSASNEIDTAHDVSIDEPANGEPAAFGRVPTHCMSESIPGFDDPGKHLMGCGGGGGGGGGGTPTRPPPPPAPTAIAPYGTCPASNPDPNNYTEVVNPCHWDHSGVSSKDSGWLKQRAIESCMGEFQAQIAAALPGGNPICQEVPAFVVTNTDSNKSWDGKRSFKASGDITLHAFVAGPFAVCLGANPPPQCGLDGLAMKFKFASYAAFND